MAFLGVFVWFLFEGGGGKKGGEALLDDPGVSFVKSHSNCMMNSFNTLYKTILFVFVVDCATLAFPVAVDISVCTLRETGTVRFLLTCAN